MISALLATAVLLPLLAALGTNRRWLRQTGLWLSPAVLLLLGMIGEQAETTLALEWLLLGGSLSVDAINRPLLLLAGIGWLLAGWFALDRITQSPAVFARFWLLTLAGQALALLSTHMAGFYAGYVVMTLAAFGLVVHSGRAEAWRAGRVYLWLALAGEALILTGLLLLSGRYANAAFAELLIRVPVDGGGAPWFLLAGFAVKLGVVPLHIWLPLAHPVAPVPASAVLSGLLVKAGLLGMLRFVPPGSLPDVQWLAVLGLCTAFYAAMVGLGQRRLKTVLAYSTVSQMGLLLIAYAGVHQVAPDLALAAVSLFAVHHGINKISLFLAAGSQPGASRLRGLLFALPSLSLVGLPLLSGAFAKHLFKESLAETSWAWVAGWLGLSSMATALLLLHAWRLASHQRRRAPLHPAWPLSVLAGLLLPLCWAWQLGVLAWPDWGKWLDGLWPAAAAFALWMAWRRRPRRLHWRWPALPEGDLLTPIQGVWFAVLSRLAKLAPQVSGWSQPAWRQPSLAAAAERVERLATRLPVAGGLLLVVLALLGWRMLG